MGSDFFFYCYSLEEAKRWTWWYQSFWRLRQEDPEFKASLARLVRLSKKNKKRKKDRKKGGGAWWHPALIPYLERRKGWIFVTLKPAWFTQQVPGQPGIHSKTLFKPSNKEEARIEYIFTLVGNRPCHIKPGVDNDTRGP